MGPALTQSALLLLPVLTGLQAVLWAQVAVASVRAAIILTIAAEIILLMMLTTGRAFGVTLPDERFSQACLSPSGLAFVAVTAAMSLSYLISVQGTHVAMIGLVELGHPLAIVVFAILLEGSVRLTPTQWVGAAFLLIGAVLVVTGGGASGVERPARP